MSDIEKTIVGKTLFLTENLYGEKFDLAKEELEGSKLNGRYKVIRKIGEGGLGIIFLVQDLHRKDEVFYCAKILKNSEHSDLLEKEVKKLEILDNKNIVNVISFNKATSSEPPFILMEYIEGETLEQHLMEKIKLDEKTAEKIFLNIAKAMEYAHSKDIIHRDLKSENIMLTKENEIKILDFGIAQLINDKEQEFGGTLKYMSPEQLENKTLTFATDIYSYGVMMYEAMSGEVPFAFGEIKYRILNEIPKKIDKISYKYWEIIKKCLEKNPKKRFKSFTELIFEFKLGNFIEENIIPKLVNDILSEEEEKKIYTLGTKEELTENQVKKCIDRAVSITGTKKLYNTHISEIIEKIENYVNDVRGRIIEKDYKKFYDKLEKMYIGLDAEEVERYCKKNIENFKKHIEETTETTYIEAEKHYLKKEFSKAAELFQILIDEGSAKAEFKIAHMYRHGIFFEKNIDKAIKLLESSSNFDYTPSLNELGNIYKSSEDYEAAIAWYEKAAELNYAPAQNNLGNIYKSGKGLEKNYEKAFEFYRKAAELNYAPAQNNLGYMYKNGLGTEKNYETAVTWYEKAAENDNSAAQVNLAYMYRQGLGVIKDSSKSVNLYEKAALSGNINAMNNLGVAYQKGEGISQNYEKAFEWYKKAAELNYAPAHNNLGHIYELGLGATQDYEKAIHHYRKASDMDYIPAHNNLGRMYENGHFVEKDYEIAFEFYKKAADKGSEKAQYNIGILYYYGNGLSKDFKEALKWFEKAYENNSLPACYKLGEMYFNGEGVEQNYQLAFNWYEQAAEKGYKEAQIKVSELYKSGYGVNKNLEESKRWLDLAGVTEQAEEIDLDDLSEIPPEV